MVLLSKFTRPKFMRGDHSSGVFFLRLSTFKRSRVSKKKYKKYLPDTANISWIRTKYVKHHQKENQQHNNTLSAYYLVCMMISVCALCCVHSSIPTIAMVIAQHEKAYICKRFLRKRIFRLIILDIVKEELLYNEKPKCNECMWMFEVNITCAPLTHTCWTKLMLIRRFINIKKHAQWSMCWGSSSIHTHTCTSTPSGLLCAYNRPVGTAYLKSTHTKTRILAHNKR